VQARLWGKGLRCETRSAAARRVVRPAPCRQLRHHLCWWAVATDLRNEDLASRILLPQQRLKTLPLSSDRSVRRNRRKSNWRAQAVHFVEPAHAHSESSSKTCPQNPRWISVETGPGEILHNQRAIDVLAMYVANMQLAEGVGFEPTRRFPAHTRSRRAPSATRPPLQALVVQRRRTIPAARPCASSRATLCTEPRDPA
jgi:hypothetical protein